MEPGTEEEPNWKLFEGTASTNPMTTADACKRKCLYDESCTAYEFESIP